MSLMTALYSGASGLEANSTELSVVGDNIANANTIGFKGSRAAFADAMAQNLIGSGGGSGGQRGLGVKLQMVQKILTQGSLVNTGVTTDLGIEGNGFFAVRGEKNGQEGLFYTRAGQFTVDKAGYLTNLSGMRVQGYTASDTGIINAASVGDLLIGEASAAPKATTGIAMKANLQADAALVTAPWDPADAGDTSNFVSSTTIYDSLGKSHQVDVYFRKTAEGAWDWHALTDGGNLAGGVAGTPSEIASGTMSFDVQGRLTDVTQTSNFTPAGAVSPQALDFDFGDPLSAPGGTGLSGVTQFAAPSATSFMNQDGYDSGLLVRVNIDNSGTVVGVFTNGLTRPLGQVSLATFEAPDQLQRVGENLLAETRGSGVATIGTPGSADRGALVAGTLEQSNVDMAAEFIRMIAAQRGFQANSKTLTTADQLLAELMTVKR